MTEIKKAKAGLRNVKLDEIETGVARCWQWFFAYPRTKIGLSDLAKSIGSSKTATKQAIEYLIGVEFITRDIIGKAWLLSANQKHPYFVSKKIPHNLSLIYESGVLDAVYKIVPSPRAVVLFGSYRWGTDVEDSDIDIAVEVIGNEDMKIVKLGVIEQLGYRKNVTVNLHIFSRNKIDLNLFSNIINGIVLDGFMEART